ncbi:universal stress protein [Nonomuraea zeae]|uniref:Universal stress protein n=1 Tax=Nonomuraea zeae TaxID=1642303 RepID=A0A5S4GS38_9ACTN|nr:universal stress protein [Nonomuraea zeae]TMR35775.1 universal stress protein [Nonomuraea zeae]
MIVVGVDGSVPARAAVDWAAGDAVRMHQSLLLVHAVDRTPYQIAKFPGPDRPDTLLRASHKVLQEAVALVHERQPTVEVTTQVVEGAPAAVLLDQGRTATELVVGSRGLGGLAGALLGSVSEHVAGQADCPVVVVHGDRRPKYGEVVVGVDDYPESQPALAYAFEQAALRGSTLRALHIWQLPVRVFATERPHEMHETRTVRQRAVADRLSTFRAEYPQVTIAEDVRCGHAVDALTQASLHADLLVVGSHGRGTVRSALLGSVSRATLHHARCTVAVVRGT